MTPGALVNGLLPERIVLVPLGVFVIAAGEPVERAH